MLELFKFIGTAFICWIFFKILKDRIFRDLIIFVVAISILGSGIIWVTNLSNKVEKKIESVNEKVNSVQKSIDKFNDSAKKVGEVKGKADKVVDKINKTDKKITDTINRWLGRDNR